MKYIDITETPNKPPTWGIIDVVEPKPPFLREWNQQDFELIEFKENNFDEEKSVPAIYLDFLLENKDLVPNEWKILAQKKSHKTTIVFTGTIFKDSFLYKKHYATLEISPNGEVEKSTVQCGFSWLGYEIIFK
jgi:hypothetical protein